MTDKKTELKRLIIFLLLAFGISWVPAIILNSVFGYHEWFETNKMPILSLPVTYGPALANVITRKITHEGWKDNLLHLNLKRNLKYYLIPVLMICVMGIGEGVSATYDFGGGDWSDFGSGYTWEQALGAVLTVFAYAPLLAFITFGEEFGWRGYMNQKLERLVGTNGAVVIGGGIWGLWHAELTVEGHNFGTDYPGFPFAGIAAMCVMCTFWGMPLMWLTKKTGSVYPAAITHALINFAGGTLSGLFISGVPEDLAIDPLKELIMFVPGFVMCAVFLVLINLDSRKKKKDVLVCP